MDFFLKKSEFTGNGNLLNEKNLKLNRHCDVSRNLKMEVSLEVGWLSYAVGKQPSKPLLILGRRTLKWWWWRRWRRRWRWRRSCSLCKYFEAVHSAKLGNLSVPQATAGVTRCSTLKILGVTVTDTLSFDIHISNVVARTVCPNRLCASHILRSHGLRGPALWNVTRATLISKLMYTSPAWFWFGFLNESCKRDAKVLYYIKAET